MPRNRGTSRKGKPKKHDRLSGMGRSLEKKKSSSSRSNRSGHDGTTTSTGGGMASSGAPDIGMDSSAKTKERSVLEMDDLTDFIQRAEMSQKQFSVERERFVMIDEVAHDISKRRVRFIDDNGEEEEERNNGDEDDNFQFCELSMPRRPKWNIHTTREELHVLEQEEFLKWRRSIAEEEERLSSTSTTVKVTPFEKNLDIWRQLWRVLERCSIMIQIVDGRNPLFYYSKDLELYCNELPREERKMITAASAGTGKIKSKKIKDDEMKNKMTLAEVEEVENGNNGDSDSDSDNDNDGNDNANANENDSDSYNGNTNNDVDANVGKPMVMVINKSDFLSVKQRHAWHTYLKSKNIHHYFFSAYLEQKKLDDGIIIHEGNDDNNNDDEVNYGVEKLLTRTELLHQLRLYALRKNCEPSPHYNNRIQFGMVGFPNVGKSSLINVLTGTSKHSHNTTTRVSVSRQPGKTKHFATVLLPSPYDDLMVCDCPGLVFPSFVNSTADLIVCGVYMIDQMRDVYGVIDLLCQRIPREIFNILYGMKLPLHGESSHFREQNTHRPLSSIELLDTYCHARGMYAASSGRPDHQRAGRILIRDYVEGKLLYCHPPPPSPPPPPPQQKQPQPQLQNDDSSSITTTSEFLRETIVTSLTNGIAGKKINKSKNKQDEAEKLCKRAAAEGERGGVNRDNGNEEQTDNDKNDDDDNSSNEDDYVDKDDYDDYDDKDDEEVDYDEDNNDSNNDFGPILDEDGIDILAVISGETTTTTATTNTIRPTDTGTFKKKNRKEHFRHNHPGPHKKKHGRKGRKHRDKDPYGCHTSGNDDYDGVVTAMLNNNNNDVSSSSPYASRASSGVIVNAGKYGKQGYTRPNYVGAKGALPFQTTIK